MYRDFLIASDFSRDDKYQAYFLGLFFRQLQTDDRATYDSIKDDIKRLNDYYNTKELSNYFNLKRHLTISSKKPVTMYVLLAFGITFIILGVKRHIEGLYTIGYSAKTQLPVYMTGLLGVIFGLTTVWISSSIIRKGLRTTKFYKKYADDNNSA
jgi:hypothetical protein